MVLTVQISETTQIQVDLAPGTPIPRMQFSWSVGSTAELRSLLDDLGGLTAWNVNAFTGLLMRYAVPVTRDGERVSSASLFIHVSLSAPEPAFPELARLAEEREELLHRDELEVAS